MGMNGAKASGFSPVAPDGLLGVGEADGARADSCGEAALNGVLPFGLVLILKDEIAGIFWRAAEAQR